VHCEKCKHIVYVGETETMLKDRIQNHLSDIRTLKKYDKPVSIHFNSSSVAKHKLLRDTKKQQDVITSNRVIMTS
jgi:glucose-6-phosphate 1-dehydrogenase